MLLKLGFKNINHNKCFVINKKITDKVTTKQFDISYCSTKVLNHILVKSVILQARNQFIFKKYDEFYLDYERRFIIFTENNLHEIFNPL